MNKEKKPIVRFKEFNAEWSIRKINQILDRASLPVTIEKQRIYREIGIRSHGKGIFHKEPVTGESIGDKRVFYVVEDAFVVNIVFAWEQAVAITSKKENGFIASHRFPMYVRKEQQSDIKYLLYFFLTKKGKALLEMASPGGAGRNKTLGQKEFENLKITVPEQEEQTKIASFLSAVDEKLTALKKKKALLEQYKQGLMQQLFSRQLRFKDDDGNDFPDWEEKKLGDCLDYEQPTNYLVSSTEYDDSFETPVVTAGKTFILGYTNERHGIFEKELPVIIFDDFTTATQFVNFPFKAKSSAMKILKAKPRTDIRFIYEAMQMINYEIGGHGRHWISVYAIMDISVPSPGEQSKIATFLSAIDEKINAVQTAIDKTSSWKKGLLQKMFV